ncbi:PIN domain-containing protein [Candidatus Woesearchaeota archaeon]|nr:PIN domain-containing protein [Candidatus Woesearchaeota archaeon]
MNRLIIDASAWIEYFTGTQKGARVRELLADSEVYTTSISLAEVSSKFKRSRLDPWEAAGIILSNSKMLNTEDELSVNAGILHAEIRASNPKFSLSDAYILRAARDSKARIVTADTDFKGFKETIFLD